MTDHIGLQRLWREVAPVPDGLVVDNIEHDDYSTDYPATQIANDPNLNRAWPAPAVHECGSRPGTDKLGRLVESVADNLIYHRVWVAPLDIDASFIVEEQEHDVKIWNAQYGLTASISDVAIVLEDGTDFELQDSDTPITLGLDAEQVYVMTVEQTGPPIQETYYTITIDSIEYEIYVHGLRVIPVDAEPEWGQPPSMRYSFQTSISTSPTFDEQRRSLINKALREALVTFVIQNNLLYRFKNTVQYGHDKIFGVPIYTEVSVLDSDVSVGGLTLSLSSSCDYHWNLNNLATHLIVVNYEDDVIEIKEIDSVASTQITLSRGLINDYNTGSLVYPCFFGTLKAISLGSNTDNTDNLKIEFKEYVLGSSE